MYCNKNISRSVTITGMNENNFRCFFRILNLCALRWAAFQNKPPA